MKYYLIAGEASGDLHAANLMRSLQKTDSEAQFRFFGGDMMSAVGGTLVKHYRELAYMGFIPVLLHLPTIIAGMRQCKQDIMAWQPDVVILVDYPGFNLKIAKFAHRFTKVYYYISPKIWAWKEYRIKNIRRDVDELFSILPFEVDFFEKKHHYPIHYVGNPTADEVRKWLAQPSAPLQPPEEHKKDTIAILCGSRKQEIKDNLPSMLSVTDDMADYDIVIAGAPAIDHEYYAQFTRDHRVSVLPAGHTYELLSHAHAALVTSGTATLETALFGVPQVVCYETPLPRLIGWLRKRMLKVKFISLVNLILGREAVRELVADTFTKENIRTELHRILDGPDRQKMVSDYDELRSILGDTCAPDNAAQIMYKLLHT